MWLRNCILEFKLFSTNPSVFCFAKSTSLYTREAVYYFDFVQNTKAQFSNRLYRDTENPLFWTKRGLFKCFILRLRHNKRLILSNVCDTLTCHPERNPPRFRLRRFCWRKISIPDWVLHSEWHGGCSRNPTMRRIKREFSRLGSFKKSDICCDRAYFKRLKRTGAVCD